MDFLIAVENTALATWIRESPSLLAYAFILFLHSAGLALLVGFNAALDLRILGVGREIPVSSMDKFYPVMLIGFWINAVSGAGLLIASASEMLVSPLFYAKLGLILLAVLNLILLRKRVLQDPYVDKRPLPMQARFLAVSSLTLWTVAMTAGRFTAYLK
jgi:uncharacterized membrane protein